MFDFVEKKLEEKVSKHKINKLKKYREEVNPVLYQNYDSKVEDPDIIILTDDRLSANEIDFLRTFIFRNSNTDMLDTIQKYLPNRKVKSNLKLQILSSVKIKPTKKDMDRNIIPFYRENSIDLQKYIKPNSKIITVGRAIYTITKSSDLDYYSFLDIIFNKSYFYDSYLKSTIFPIPNLNKLFADNYDKFFAYYQINKASYFKSKKVRHDKIIQVTVDNPNEFLKKHMDYDGMIAWDLETKTLDPWNPEGKILEFTGTFDGKTGYYLQWDKVNKKLFEKFISNKKSIGSNLKYDIKWLIVKEGMNRKSFENYIGDTWPLAHLMNEMRKNGLKPLSWIYTTLGGYDSELDAYKEKYPKCKNDYSLIPIKIRKPYAITDPCVSWLVYERLLEQMKQIDKKFPINDRRSLHKFYFEIMMPFWNSFIDVELYGMHVDWDMLDNVSKEFNEIRLNKREKIYKSLGDNITEDDVNIDSSESLGLFIENTLNWECIERSKKGHYKTNDMCLTQWVKKGYTQAKLISEYRSMCTIYNTFLGDKDKVNNSKIKSVFGFEENLINNDDQESDNGYWKYRKSDDRIHPNFGVMLTHSLRNWCKDPNTQNLPGHGDYVSMLRSFFSVPSDEYYLAELDGAGLQLRIVGAMSGDEGFNEAFNILGGDLHSMTGQNIFCPEISLEEFIKYKNDKSKPYKGYRYKSKGANFSLVFYTTAFAFAKSSLQSEWSLEDAKKYVLENNLEKRRKVLFTTGLNSIKEADGSFNEVIDKVSRQDAEEFSYYWASAEDIKDKFFKKYFGVKAWIESQVSFADNHGYIRSEFGPIRRLPQLIYYNHDDRECKREAKGYHNIACNSPVQTFEIFLIAKTINQLRNYILENNLKTKIVGQVHDSIVMYIYKSEKDIIVRKAKEYFEEDIPENNGIPQELECEISDYHAEFGSEYYYEYFDEEKNEMKIKDHRYWKFGKEYKV